MKLYTLLITLIFFLTTNTALGMLIQVAKKGNALQVEALLKKGLDPNEQDNQGNTALHYAAMKGHSKIAELLLSYGAEAGTTNKFGTTPLMWAESKHHNDIITLLKSHKRKRQEPQSKYKKGKVKDEDVMDEVDNDTHFSSLSL